MLNSRKVPAVVAESHRRPSAAVLTKSLRRAAANAERLAVRLKKLGEVNAAQGVELAARELSHAAVRLDVDFVQRMFEKPPKCESPRRAVSEE